MIVILSVDVTYALCYCTISRENLSLVHNILMLDRAYVRTLAQETAKLDPDSNPSFPTL